MNRTLTFEKTQQLYKDFQKFKNRYNESQLFQIADILLGNLLYYQIVDRASGILNYLLDKYRIVLITKCESKDSEHKNPVSDKHNGYMSIREKKYFLLHREICLNFVGNTMECIERIMKLLQGCSNEFAFFHSRARTCIVVENYANFEPLIRNPQFPHREFFVGYFATTRGKHEDGIQFFNQANCGYMSGMVNFEMGRYELALFCFMKELFEKKEKYSKCHYIWLRIGDCFHELSKISIYIEEDKKLSKIVPQLNLSDTKYLIEYALVSYNNVLRFHPPHFKMTRQSILLRISFLYLRQENHLFAYDTLKKIEFKFLSNEYDRICYIEYMIESLMIDKKWKEMDLFMSSEDVRSCNLSTLDIAHRPYILYLFEFFKGNANNVHGLFLKLLEMDNCPDQLRIFHRQQPSPTTKQQQQQQPYYDIKLHFVRFLIYFLSGNVSLAKNVVVVDHENENSSSHQAKSTSVSPTRADQIRKSKVFLDFIDLIHRNEKMKKIRNSEVFYSL